jgi:hypothetical protein
MNSCPVKRSVLLFSLLLAGSFFYPVHAQTYRLRAFGGGTVPVRVYEQATPRALVVACATDMIKVSDYWALDTAAVWNRQFLQLDYAVRAGANLGAGNTLVLCVARGKLCQAWKAATFREYDLRNVAYIPGNPDEYQVHRAQLRLSGTTPSTYRLRLTTYDERRSARAPTNNHRSTTQAVLKFDAGRHLFYTGH